MPEAFSTPESDKIGATPDQEEAILEDIRSKARERLVLSDRDELTQAHEKLLVFLQENPSLNHLQFLSFINKLLEGFNCEIIGKNIATRYLLGCALRVISESEKHNVN